MMMSTSGGLQAKRQRLVWFTLMSVSFLVMVVIHSYQESPILYRRDEPSSPSSSSGSSSPLLSLIKEHEEDMNDDGSAGTPHRLNFAIDFENNPYPHQDPPSLPQQQELQKQQQQQQGMIPHHSEGSPLPPPPPDTFAIGTQFSSQHLQAQQQYFQEQARLRHPDKEDDERDQDVDDAEEDVDGSGGGLLGLLMGGRNHYREGADSSRMSEYGSSGQKGRNPVHVLMEKEEREQRRLEAAKKKKQAEVEAPEELAEGQERSGDGKTKSLGSGRKTKEKSDKGWMGKMWSFDLPPPRPPLPRPEAFLRAVTAPSASSAEQVSVGKMVPAQDATLSDAMDDSINHLAHKAETEKDDGSAVQHAEDTPVVMVDVPPPVPEAEEGPEMAAAAVLAMASEPAPPPLLPSMKHKRAKVVDRRRREKREKRVDWGEDAIEWLPM